MAIKLYIR